MRPTSFIAFLTLLLAIPGQEALAQFEDPYPPSAPPVAYPAPGGPNAADPYQNQYQPATLPPDVSPQSPYKQPAGAGQTAALAPAMSVKQWFIYYDQIRRRAQMNPQERQRADTLLSKGMSILMPGPDKIAARSILIKLQAAYAQASRSIRQLPVIPQTQQLHQGYQNYFDTAYQLFSDYLKVQDNPFALDKVTGKPVAGQLISRKVQLESLNNSIQGLDQQVRQVYGIAAYAYSQ